MRSTSTSRPPRPPRPPRTNPPDYRFVAQQLQDEAIVGLFRRPNTVARAARFAKKPIQDVLVRVRRLRESGELIPLGDGKLVNRQFAAEVQP